MTTSTITIDKQQIKEELEKRQVLELQKQLIKERRNRIIVMALLLSALLLTFVYGTLENPFVFTFSKIGNRFTVRYRYWFIIWAIYTGISIQTAILYLMKLENYKNKLHPIYIAIGTIFLVFTSLAPSIPEEMPFWYYMHLATSGLFALFVTMGFYPFMIWVARENPRLRRTVYYWLGLTWGGAILWYFTFGNKGLFEMWFFVLFIIFLLYLSLTLYEEKIVKLSIKLLRDEENLNLGIEKIFIDLEHEERSRKKRKQTK